TRWVGCRPVTRNSSFETYGCAGSWRTGPAPLVGGINARSYTYHPIFRSGAKLGGASPAIAEKLTLPAKQTTPMRMLAVKFPPCLDIGASSADTINPAVAKCPGTLRHLPF